MIEGNQGRNLKAGTKPEARRKAPYWLVLCDLLLSYTTQDYLPKGGTTDIGLDWARLGWILPYQSLLKKIPLQTCT